MVSLTKVLEDINCLELLVDVNIEDIKIKEMDLTRPGLELIGYNEYFGDGRVQIFGMHEHSFLLRNEIEESHVSKYLSNDIPLIVFCRDLEPSEKFLQLAEEKNIPVAKTKKSTSKFQAILFEYLEEELAPSARSHGVLVSVYGLGIIIKGKSGIGKSEIALELIHRGHFLVADDAVVIKRTDENTLIGSAPEILRNRMEIRGIGIVNIQKLYGITRVIEKKKIDLVIEIEPMTGNEDRIGTKEDYEEILDNKIPKITIPIKEGRSIANLVEVAVANHELKHTHGYDSANVFLDDLEKSLIEGRCE